MSNEERKAFESVKDMFGDVTLKDIDEQSITIYGVAMLDVIKVLTIVEKQEKEIEHQIEKRANQRNELAILNAKQIEFNKLVNTVNSYKGQFKRQEKEIEELKEKNRQEKMRIVQLENEITARIEDVNKYFTPNDKIKEKIEEVKDGTYDAKIVLQSLLEKGK